MEKINNPKKTIRIEVWRHTWGGKTLRSLLVADRRVAGLKMFNATLESWFSVDLDTLQDAIEEYKQSEEN